MRTLLALLAALALVATACGDDTPTVTDDATDTAPPATEPTDDGATEPTGTPATTDGADQPEDGATLASAETDLGTIVADAEGRSLYLFRNDNGEESTCYDQCAQTWPPLTVEGEPTVSGDLDPALVGTTARTDGTTQVTYGGHPLYHFAGDEAPGDTNGQGRGDVWFVVAPTGDAIEGGAAAGYGGSY